MIKPKRILVTDDEPDIASAACMWLQSAGFETMVARDGLECLDTTREHRPDAVVLDVRMPKEDGLTVLTKLKELPETRHIPIVMLSASLVDQQRALDTGARFFLTKPYDGHRLVAAVAAALKDSESEHE